EQVRLEAEEPLAVVVVRGATVIGRIEPAELVPALREAAGLPRRGSIGRLHAKAAPGARLSRADGSTVPPETLAECVALDDDGASFRITGVPPGDWFLELAIPLQVEDRAIRRAIAIRGLRDGEERSVVLELAEWLPGRLTGMLEVDGQARAGTFSLLAADLGGSWQEPESSALTIETEPDGSFEA